MDDYSIRLGKKRLRFRDWLIDKLNTGEIEGVQWIDRERGLFRIPWVHGSHHTWNRNDVEIFRQWAMYSGKYEPLRGIPDHRKWKTNFRCTLNGLRDFKEVRIESCSRGPRRFKIYSLESIEKGKKEQSPCEKKAKQATAFDLTDKEVVQMVDEITAPEPITRPASQKLSVVSRTRPNAAYPAFETLVMGKSTGIYPFPYTPWFLAAWNAMAVDQHVEKPEMKNFADLSAAEESGSQGTTEGVQTKRLVRKQESREIRNHKWTFTEEELAGEQEIIDLVDQMMAAESDRPEELDGTEESNGPEYDFTSDQEIIDLVDQMSDQNSSSLEELDGMEESNEKEDGEPNDQEIIDLVDQMSDQLGELDGKEGSDVEDDGEPNDQEIIDLVDQMSDPLGELDSKEGSNVEEDGEPNDQEIIDLVDQMSDPLGELDSKEGSNVEDDGESNDQEIIDLVDQMSDPLGELDGKEGSDEKDDGKPSDQESIDLVEQMSDSRVERHGGIK